jgi:hypothetical protein
LRRRVYGCGQDLADRSQWSTVLKHRNELSGNFMTSRETVSFSQSPAVPSHDLLCISLTLYEQNGRIRWFESLLCVKHVK